MRVSALLSVLSCFLGVCGPAAAEVDQHKIKTIIDDAVRPIVRQYNVPGMAIAVTVQGERFFYNDGVSSKNTRQPVTSKTLFEIGSISKAFTATLAAYAQADGKLSLDDKVVKHLPSLRGSRFEQINLVNLGTHTAGGFPLQVPEELENNDQLMEYFRRWQSVHPAGSHRTYSNLSIGLLGMIAASSLGLPFDDAIEKKLFPALGMSHSYIHVPAEQRPLYAQGYTRSDAPIRLNAGLLASETYGVKSNAADMLRFIEANMQMVGLDGKLQRALIDTHTGYFKAGEMTQDLIWEQYPYPANLKQVLAGNADAMVYESKPVIRLDPPLPPASGVFINKTGSTNGFAAYVAFIPARKLGIVILANKNYPVAARVTAAHQILTELDKAGASGLGR